MKKTPLRPVMLIGQSMLSVYVMQPVDSPENERRTLASYSSVVTIRLYGTYMYTEMFTNIKLDLTLQI